VRFIHEARNDAEKARLFAACRAGHVSVLVGSTEKMGVGTNIQDRCVAIHHVDVPWRPADIEQRDGRGVRQGNQNPEIAIYRYAVQGSFDTYSWQTVERKARFIAQVMRGRLDAREIEDIGENALSFAEVEALASGDPLILEKARADAEATRLARLERAWQRSHQNLRHTIAGAEDRAAALDRQLQGVAAALERRRDTRGERFTMTVAGRELTARGDAEQALAAHLARIPYGQRVPVGQLGGLAIDAEIRGDHHGRALVELTPRGLPAAPASVEGARLGDASVSLVRQLEHRVERLGELSERLQGQRQQALGEAASGREQLARPFKYARELAAARQEQQRIDQQIAERHREHQNAEHADATAVDADSVHPQTSAPAAHTTPAAPPAAEEAGNLEPETAESLRLLRATQAAPITEALRSPPAPGPPPRPPARSPSRSSRPRR
jgi:Helicase conserved C-terminal domain